MTLHAMAFGVLMLACATMTRAVKAVSTYRGRDPRDFVLVAFGGNGPVVAAEVARALQMRRVLVPPAPGVFSAVGLLFSDMEYQLVRTVLGLPDSATTARMAAVFAEMEIEASASIAAGGASPAKVVIERAADLRYRGQAYELTVELGPGAPDFKQLCDGFHAEHERTYGYRSEAEPVELVNLKVVARVPLAATALSAATVAWDEEARASRDVYYGPSCGIQSTLVGSRSLLADGSVEGPLIIEEVDATCVIPPACRASLDAFGNVDIEVHASPLKANIDPITFEVIRNALASIADEMALIVMRSAVSPVVRDTMDYSTAVCDRNGQMIAQGLTLAVQLGAFPDIMRIITAEHAEGIRDGDVFIANDPYGSGGQHLPDIYVIKPIVIDNALRGYAATMAHHCDVGGLTPGSVAIHATDIHQEGLRLPLLKLYAAGQPNEAVFAIIDRNTRLPGQVLGDIRAQLAALSCGRARPHGSPHPLWCGFARRLPHRLARSGRTRHARRYREHSRRAPPVH